MEATSARRMTTADLTASLRVAIARLSRRIRAEKADDDLSDSQVSVLALLYRDGAQTPGQLSEFERVKPPSMNRTINALVAHGHIERSDDPNDGRRVYVTITPSGRLLVEETRRRRDAWLFRRLSELSADDRRTLSDAVEILHRLTQR